MGVDKPTAVQVMVAWRDNRWVVRRNTVEMGSYAYRTHAMDMARRVAAEARRDGMDCYMLLRNRDGSWEERPCPKARPAPPQN